MAATLPVQSLQERREEVGSIGFTTQYQGWPVPPEGRMIQRAWFPRYTYGAHPKLSKIVFGVDCASTTKKSSDSSAIVVVGVTPNRDSYVLDCVAQKVEFVDLVRLLKNVYERWKTDDIPLTVYVEQASAGTQLVQVLKSESGLPVRGVQTTSKAKKNVWSFGRRPWKPARCFCPRRRRGLMHSARAILFPERAP